MSDVPTVTVVIPARNEQADIERCLGAILAQDHPHDRMEVVVVDGGSSDRTVELASRALAAGDVSWRIEHHPVGTTPSNLNVGLAVASGDVVCRVDARSIVPVDYVRICAEVLKNNPAVVVVGGAQVAAARERSSAVERGIVRALNNRYGMGGSRYRRGARSGPSDTVYLGAFRSEQLRSVGGWNEDFPTNQDFELNRRLGRLGVVWFTHDLVVGYLPRRTVREIAEQYHRFGRWKVRYWRITGERPLARQRTLMLVPPLTVVGGVMCLYLGRRRLELTGAVVIAGAVGLVGAVDHLGSRGKDTLMVRFIASAVSAVVAASWWSGVMREWAAGVGGRSMAGARSRE